MAYNRTTGVYTAPTGSETATAGQTIASAIWNSIFTDMATSFNQLGTGQVTMVSLNSGTPAQITASVLVMSSTASSFVFNVATGNNPAIATLPSPVTFPGRILNFKTIAATALTSATSNVVLLTGGAAQTLILTSTAGKWAVLISDATVWQVMSGN